MRKYRELEYGELIVVGADGAAGGADYCAAQFFSKTKLDVPWVYHEKKVTTEMTADLYPILNEIYDKTGIPPVVAYESNFGGLFELERLNRLSKEGKYLVYTDPDGKLGWATNTATRPKLLSELKEAIENRLFKIYDKPTIDELLSFVVKRTPTGWKPQAESGAHDDLVISLGIAYQIMQSAVEYKRTYIPPFDLLGGGRSEGYYV